MPEREKSIRTVIVLLMFHSLLEIKRALKTSNDTCPGIDRIYSKLNHLDDHALSQITTVFNTSLTLRRLPWKEVNFQPIPKNITTATYHPISLVSCLSKKMERAILARLPS